jgi:hypothetical protein
VRRRRGWIAGALAAALCSAAGAAAQEQPAETTAPSVLRVFGDLLLRGEAVRKAPNPETRDFERVRLRFRPAMELRLGDRVTMGAGLLASIASDDNDMNGIRFDNFESDDVRFDLAYARLSGVSRAVSGTLGVFETPFMGTEVIWDRDLRFQGGSFGAELPSPGALVSQRVVAAATVGSQMHEQSSQAAAVRWDGELPHGFSAGVEFWTFGRTDVLVEEGYARTNRIASGGEDLLSDFDVAHVTLGWETLGASRPLRLRLELFHNFGADDERDGGELRADWGELQDRWSWRARLVVQRIEQDAVLAAFGGDEWWFRTRQRGARAAFALALARQVFVEVSVLRQRRDDLDEWLDRGIIDLIVRL